MSDEKAAYALGYLQSWIEKVGMMSKVETDEPLRHLKVLDKSFDYYVRTLGAYAQKQLQTPAMQLDKRTREEREAEGEKDE